jgi:hypothetical protein
MCRSSFTPASCNRAAFRYSQKPTDRYDHIGFRAALSVEAVRKLLKRRAAAPVRPLTVREAVEWIINDEGE